MKDREKEIKYLIYLKSQIIKQTKKEIKNLHRELDELNKSKSKSKIRNKNLIWHIYKYILYYLIETRTKYNYII